MSYVKHLNSKKEENGGRTKEYISWMSIKARCLSKDSQQYKYYGARGISICEEWLANFQNFLNDMGKAPSSLHTIDRVDNNKGYCPQNCRWATKKEQARNRRSTNFFYLNGEKLTGTEYAIKIGVAPSTFRYRLALGWSLDKIKSEPPRRGPRRQP